MYKNNVTTEERFPIYGDEPETQQTSKLPLSEQEKAISILHDKVNLLERRLAPVLEPVYPSDEAEGKVEPEREGSPLYTQLSANNRGIRRASEALDRLLSRLEC